MHIQAGDSELLIRSAEADDDEFILGLVERLVDFELPKWRKKNVVSEGIRRDLTRHLENQPPGSFLFIAEDAVSGDRLGFLHLQTVTDYFTGHLNCHVSDLVVTKGADGRGIGRALLGYAEDFAREHRCERLTLAVFPGNTRAKELYESAGFGVELLRMAKPL
jgi:ribosomal protein S18 acetylase RimI-like enzyme